MLNHLLLGRTVMRPKGFWREEARPDGQTVTVARRHIHRPAPPACTTDKDADPRVDRRR